MRRLLFLLAAVVLELQLVRPGVVEAQLCLE